MIGSGFVDLLLQTTVFFFLFVSFVYFPLCLLSFVTHGGLRSYSFNLTTSLFVGVFSSLCCDQKVLSSAAVEEEPEPFHLFFNLRWI